MQLIRQKSNLKSFILMSALALLASVPLFFFKGTEAGASLEAVVTVDGEIVRRVPLSADKEKRFTVSTPYGNNEIVVRGGKVFVEDADCPEKVCIKNGAISTTGEIIACLPHHLLLEIRKVK